MDPQKTSRTRLTCAGLFFVITCAVHAQQPSVPDREKTIFQTAGPWKPLTDIRADAAVIYGTRDSETMTFEQRVQSWRDRGYTTHFMTGIAWGDYQDYFTGRWDGKMHLDEGQVQRNGDTIWHGHLVPYIVPSENFLRYLKEKHIKRVIDAGIDAIYFEEPEFWARAGYSESFRNAWKKYYGFDWRPPHESPENTYLSNKLKYQLYHDAIRDVCTFAKEYGQSKGLDVRCYIPTHSLVNYSQWQIVSPEAALASLPCVDGYIAQVWTGTSRTANLFDGKQKERVFETAFLEYGSMESMTEPTGRKLFFLTDPIEDWPRDWVDYKKNYQATFTAKLLYPTIANYEVMPWPDRIYEGLYKTSVDSDRKERIPRFYSTQMQVMINALNTMPESDNRVSGSHGISVLMGNSLMFQRFPEHEGHKDPHFSNFYGQALPFLKRGIPVKTVHIENLAFAKTLAGTKVLIMSYTNMKPLSPEPHHHLAEWVRKGGVLVYCGKDTDPFQSVQEWWNKGEKKYSAPSAHLFEQLNLGRNPQEGEYTCGKGTVCLIRRDPAEFVSHEGGDAGFVHIVRKMYEEKAQAGTLTFKNSFTLTRGPYQMIAVLDESISAEPYIAKGLFIDLFDSGLPVLQEKTVPPGEQALLYDLSHIANKSRPQVVASACRIYDEKITPNTYTFVAKSPKETSNAMRILLPKPYTKCTVTDSNNHPLTNLTHHWDAPSATCLLTFENDPDGIQVSLEWNPDTTAQSDPQHPQPDNPPPLSH
jgi:hypothetical protein